MFLYANPNPFTKLLVLHTLGMFAANVPFFVHLINKSLFYGLWKWYFPSIIYYFLSYSRYCRKGTIWGCIWVLWIWLWEVFPFLWGKSQAFWCELSLQVCWFSCIHADDCYRNRNRVWFGVSSFIIPKAASAAPPPQRNCTSEEWWYSKPVSHLPVNIYCQDVFVSKAQNIKSTFLKTCENLSYQRETSSVLLK